MFILLYAVAQASADCAGPASVDETEVEGEAATAGRQLEQAVSHGSSQASILRRDLRPPLELGGAG